MRTLTRRGPSMKSVMNSYGVESRQPIGTTMVFFAILGLALALSTGSFGPACLYDGHSSLAPHAQLDPALSARNFGNDALATRGAMQALPRGGATLTQQGVESALVGIFSRSMRSPDRSPSTPLKLPRFDGHLHTGLEGPGEGSLDAGTTQGLSSRVQG